MRYLAITSASSGGRDTTSEVIGVSHDLHAGAKNFLEPFYGAIATVVHEPVKEPAPFHSGMYKLFLLGIEIVWMKVSEHRLVFSE